MGSTGLTPKDFKRLPKDGARFETLVCQLLEAMGYRILEKPAVGTEGGRDVLVERTVKDAMVERREKVVVQCKHYARSGRAIGDKEVGVWQNAMARYKARGYLLVTDTRVTENLRRSFREFTEDEANYPKWAAFWDVDEIIVLLNKHPDVRDSFFPPEAVKRTPLEDLAVEVRTWLQAIRYKVDEPQRLDDRNMSMVAVMDEGTVKQRVLVRCIGGEITPTDVDALDKVLDRKTPQGWLISDKRVSDRARERAAEDDAFQVFTLADFLRQMVWGPYFDALTSLVEKDQIPDLYVDLGCYKQEMGEEGHEVIRDRYASLDAYIDDWLTERGKMHISLLGEFGTGKTWFCRHYAYRQLESYLEDPANERLPLLITLRAFAKAMTAQQLINDALLEQYKLPFVGSAFQVFQEMNRRGKLLLILDGFDEMARQVDYQTVVDNFWALAELVDEGSKVILTSRTEYFRWAKESEKILGGEEFGRRTIVLSPPKFEVLYLEPFSDDQIREVIRKRLGAEEGPSVAERILETPNLAEMARKPVLVELLLAALDEVSADVLENPAQVYLYATDRLLLRNIDTKRTFTTTADKLYFLCELAWEMIRSGELRIHYTDIPERIKAYFGDRIKDQHELDTWDYDLRNQTLLHRDGAGYYEFAHKSLAEYFAAFKFAAESGCLALAFAQTYCGADGQPSQVPIEQKDIIGLAETFGAVALTDERMRAVRDLLPSMIASDREWRLWEIVGETKGKAFEQVCYAGTNAAMLLNLMGQSFAGRDLAETVLVQAELLDVDLTNANCHKTQLQGVQLSNPTLTNVDFTQANLDDIRLIEYSRVESIAFSSDDRKLLIATEDGSVQIWDINMMAPVVLLRSPLDDSLDVRIWRREFYTWAARYSPDDKRVAAGRGSYYGLNYGAFVLWNAATGRRVLAEERISLGVNCIEFSPDGRYVFMGCGDQYMDHEEDLVASEGLILIWDVLEGKEGQRVACNSLVEDLSYDPNRRLLANGRDDGMIEILEADTLTRIHFFKAHSSYITSVCFSPDGRYLASGAGYEDVGVKLWEVETARCLYTLEGHFKVLGEDKNLAVRSVCYNLKGNYLVSAGDDARVIVWNLDSMQQELVLSGHGTGVTAACFSPSGKRVASGSTDGIICIWDVDTNSPTFGQCLRVLEVRRSYKGMQISGAHGLEREWGDEGEEKDTLLEFLANRGAVLDEEQERILAELRKRREADDYAK